MTAISPPQGVYEPAAAGSSSQPQAGPSNGSPSSQKDDLAGTGATEDDNDDAFDDFDDFDAAPPAGAETGIVLNGEEGDGDGFGDFEEGDFGDEMTAALSTTAQTVVTVSSLSLILSGAISSRYPDSITARSEITAPATPT